MLNSNEIGNLNDILALKFSLQFSTSTQFSTYYLFGTSLVYFVVISLILDAFKNYKMFTKNRLVPPKISD